MVPEIKAEGLILVARYSLYLLLYVISVLLLGHHSNS